MAEQFKNQGGTSTSDPSPPLRWLTSMMIRRMTSQQRLVRERTRQERRRKSRGEPHRVEYFHQVDDGYSQLAAQLLQRLAERYDVELVCHLVAATDTPNLPEPDLLLALSRRDAAAVAPHYGLEFPADVQAPAREQVRRVEALLAACDTQAFARLAPVAGAALWAGDVAAIDALATETKPVDPPAVEAALAAGNARRETLGHYSGAMFHYAGEWYWGVDRLYHLELRLRELGVDRQPEAPLLAPRPPIEDGPLQGDGQLTLEIYPSLRSPYTSIVFDRACQLAQATGVRLVVRPVLPMVMRGVPATLAKGRYIMTDTAREARANGLPWGRMYDPIGNPVRRAYALWPWACEQGRGNELLSAFMRAAFGDGINTNNSAGLRHVVEAAGLNWSEAQHNLDDTRWEALVETNRQAMYAFGSWGVPTFRLLDADGKQVLALWGQDRLWLFAREIQRLLAAG